jgi:hypothetical protein
MDEAVETRADWRAEKIHDLAVRVEAGKMDPQSARVAIDAHKMLAAKESPRRYGDKASVELAGKDGKDLIPESAKRDDLELARWLAFMWDKAARESAAAKDIVV